MGIENYPCIQDLERFVEKLPKEHRAEVYRVAERFYSIGAGDGAMVGAIGTLVSLGGGTDKPIEDRSALWREYLNRRAREVSA